MKGDSSAVAMHGANAGQVPVGRPAGCCDLRYVRLAGPCRQSVEFVELSSAYRDGVMPAARRQSSSRVAALLLPFVSSRGVDPAQSSKGAP